MLNPKKREIQIILGREIKYPHGSDLCSVVAKDKGEVGAEFDKWLIEFPRIAKKSWDTPQARNPEFFLGLFGRRVWVS